MTSQMIFHLVSLKLTRTYAPACMRRSKLSENRLVKYYNQTKDVPGLVTSSMLKTIEMFPAVGWVRANTVSNQDMLSELNELRKQNDSLKDNLARLDRQEKMKLENLAELDECFTIHGECTMERSGKAAWKSSLSWKEIFGYISPYLLKYPNDTIVKKTLTSALVEREFVHGKYPHIRDQDFQTITLQLKALGLVETTYTAATNGDMALFWSVTSQGERLMMQLRTVASRDSVTSS